jgi:hypothetical protein
MTTPRPTPSRVAAADIQSTLRPPLRKRLQTSRPSASVPNSASDDGALLGTPMNSVGECGARSGPNRAIRIRIVTIAMPILVRPSRSALRRIPSHAWRWRAGAPGPAGPGDTSRPTPTAVSTA